MMRPFTVSILLSFLLIDTQAFDCPDNYDQIPREDKCIVAVNQLSFYARAARYCSSKGGLIVKIENIYENAFLQAYISQDVDGAAIYIGVERDLNNTWTYADGNPLTYKNWAPNEPKNASNSSLCAIMNPQNGLWYSSECGYARPFYCSFDGDTLQCPPGWVYSNETDRCYYLQDFTYPDSVHWQLYNFSIAEANCQRMNSHLVSIHSKEEDLFVYDLIQSNVSNFPVNVVPNNTPCGYLWAWIGLVGSGVIGNGTWTDGSPVDYTGAISYGSPPDINWVIANDPECHFVQWASTRPDQLLARYVCKMPSRGRRRGDSLPSI